MASNRGEVEKDLAHIINVDIFEISKVFGPLITIGSQQQSVLSIYYSRSSNST